MFRVENKVEASLRQAQVLHYRKDWDDSYLIALTKYPPEPGARWLREHRAHAPRWQQVHRALSREKPRNRVDRFLFTRFSHYLEELGMAHRDDLRINDLRELHRLFQAITAPKRYSPGGLSSVFSTADACLGVLDEVVEAIRDSEPRFRRWSLNGPSYFKWTERGEGSDHNLAFRFRLNNWHKFIGAGFRFPEEASHGDVAWQVDWRLPAEDGRQHHISAVCDRSGVLDTRRMVDVLLSDCRKCGL